MRVSRHVFTFIATAIVLAQFACAADKESKPAAGATTKPASSASEGELRRLHGLEGWHVTGNGNWTYKDGIIEGKQGADVVTSTPGEFAAMIKKGQVRWAKIIKDSGAHVD